MTTVVHPMSARALLVLSAALTCSGCAREYVHWEPDVSVAARRADSLPDDRAARVRLVNRQNLEARDIAFEGERLRWSDPHSGLVSTLPLSQVDSVRVQGKRKVVTGALIGALAGYVGLPVWVGCFRLLCDFSGSGLRLQAVLTGIGAVAGAISGWIGYGGVTFVR